MELNYAMSYRITTLEIEQAAIRAERARMIAENADMIVRRDGVLRRVLRRLQGGRRTEAVTAPAQAAAVPAEPAPVKSAPATAAGTPAVGSAAQIAELVPASDQTRDRELVGCGSHAA